MGEDMIVRTKIGNKTADAIPADDADWSPDEIRSETICLLVRSQLSNPIAATLTEREWRLLRFAVERARDSI